MGTVSCNTGVCDGACAGGYSDCDANKQTNGCETQVSSDPNNCGGCGVTCSTSNMATVTCSGGTCNGACLAGFADCDNNKLADGCEANLATSPASCGACGVACSSNHMATVTCGGGTCNGTCAAGYADCDGNKVTNGCETSTNTDASNCGGCGNACPTGESCVSGVCQTCNSAVLLLSDGQTTPDSAVVAALQTAGLTTTVIDAGATTYTGTPNPMAFGAVLVIVGNAYTADMPINGQSTIVNAFTSGTGFVVTEWAAYEVNSGRWTTLQQLLLATYSSGTTVATTYTLTSANHPVWTGLPTSFTTTVAVGGAIGTVINGGTRIATSSSGSNGIIVRDVIGTQGRIVHIDHAANYSPTWTSDPNLLKMFTNAARWAAKCQ